MAKDERELFYERRVRATLDALEELERMELAPGLSEDERDAVREQIPHWNREYTLASAQWRGVRSGLSMLPMPSEEARKRLAALSDAVERQVNANRAANNVVGAATAFAGMLNELQAIA